MANPVCKICEADNKQSDVIRTSQKIIGEKAEPFRDAGGNVHWHDPSVADQWFTCTNHHTFNVLREAPPCPSCAYHWKNADVVA